MALTVAVASPIFNIPETLAMPALAQTRLTA